MLNAMILELGRDSIKVDQQPLTFTVESETMDHYETTLSYVEMAKMILEKSEPHRLGQWMNPNG